MSLQDTSKIDKKRTPNEPLAVDSPARAAFRAWALLAGKGPDPGAHTFRK